MVLTKKEKKLLIRVLKKEKRRVFGSKENKQEISQLIDKLEQSTRNEKVNEVNPSKL
ncbi:hypothetical protein K8O68_12360 [Salipaludibacillus sp. CUR1]|uniref:Uncharacterized protein n=1 Tax=Salipaludibacillus aurantiacus TaxID=1601833 RepID=A0A1H9P0Y3_9BACI|nr:MULTISPECIES: hypothetical protein [Salipaludibacillus]MCE7793211.1 hypothetical protein [Salipaludibacillus sp. CUR1]SER41848.1 hypothetical protein SAMN05518684_10197 [Salipaludibacillus aurantiacus]